MKQTVAKMEAGLAAGVFPGAVLLVAHRKKIVLHRAFGWAMITPNRVEMTRDTVFDLASLTKPLVTAAAVARLLQQNRLALENPVKKYLPVFSGGEKDQVTLFHLLNHSSGLPAWRPYYEKIIKRDKITPGFLGSNEAKKCVFEMARREALVAQPGEKSCYSDIGFILLEDVIETITQMPLDVFFKRHIRPAAASCEAFFPAEQKTRYTPGRVFAATEEVSWRGGVISGIVHDDNAFVMGGVAGHAGLFATALDVYRLLALWRASLEGSGLFDTKNARLFVTRQAGRRGPAGASWGLGWDTPSHPSGTGGPGVSSSGRFFSPESFGHLGFTGTSIWVDPKHDLTVILLTNRVHPSRENVSIRVFRPALHDIIFKEVVHG